MKNIIYYLLILIILLGIMFSYFLPSFRSTSSQKNGYCQIIYRDISERILLNKNKLLLLKDGDITKEILGIIFSEEELDRISQKNKNIYFLKEGTIKLTPYKKKTYSLRFIKSKSTIEIVVEDFGFNKTIDISQQ